MKIETARFGAIEVAPEDLVTFPDGLPGFEAKRFALVPDPEAPLVLWLQALEDPTVALMTVDPVALGVDFEPRFKPAETRVVAPEGVDTVECRVIARGEADGTARLNLFAPLLVNRGLGLAAQLPLVGSGYGTEAPWPPPDPSATVREP